MIPFSSTNRLAGTGTSNEFTIQCYSGVGITRISRIARLEFSKRNIKRGRNQMSLDEEPNETAELH